LSYSAEYMEKHLSNHFPTPAICNAYAYHPEEIASRFYASRNGNGDEASKDGWKFRGRGYIQLTGKVNYAAFSEFAGEDVVTNPDLVANKYPLLSAGWFFLNNNLFALSAQGATDEVVKSVTHVVNGGLDGLDDRIRYFNTFYAYLQ
jgi:putative chitinase